MSTASALSAKSLLRWRSHSLSEHFVSGRSPQLPPNTSLPPASSKRQWCLKCPLAADRSTAPIPTQSVIPADGTAAPTQRLLHRARWFYVLSLPPDALAATARQYPARMKFRREQE